MQINKYPLTAEESSAGKKNVFYHQLVNADCPVCGCSAGFHCQRAAHLKTAGRKQWPPHVRGAKNPPMISIGVSSSMVRISDF